jgi:hypothetical protein
MPTPPFRLIDAEGEEIFTGGPSVEFFLSNLDTNQYLTRAAEQLARVDARLTALAQRDDQQQTAAIQAMCDGISRMARRLDALSQSRAGRHRLGALSEQTERELALPADALDPDDPDAVDVSEVAAAKRDRDAEIPGVNPGDPPQRHPGETSFEYLEGADSPTGTLPPGIERPPETGELAVWDPTDLTYPQRPQQEPAAIGGP